jgi:hypothetical protein
MSPIQMCLLLLGTRQGVTLAAFNKIFPLIVVSETNGRHDALFTPTDRR